MSNDGDDASRANQQPHALRGAMNDDRDNPIDRMRERRRSLMRRCRPAALILPMLLLVAACAQMKVDPFADPLRPAREAPDPVAPDADGPEQEFRSSRAPGVVLQQALAEGVADRLGEQLSGPPIEVSFHDLSLVTFINEVFGEQLGMSFVIAPGLSDGAEPVTLRLTEPVPPKQLFHVARNVLSQYGITLREEEGVLTFARREDASAGDVPLVTSGGRALPQVPDSHRTIFHFVPLHVAGGRAIEDVIEDAFDGQDLSVENDRDRGGLLLMGRRALIEQALAIIETLDQPLIRSRHAAILEPAFIDAPLLVEEMTRVLNAEGYVVGTSVLLLPIEHLNKVVAFSANRATLAHVEEWAAVLDAARQDAIEDAWFTYEVRNTQAAALTATLNVMLRGDRRPAAGAVAGGGALGSGAGTGGARQDTGVTSFGGLVVDQNRNVLLFRGSGREWADLLSVIKVLDKPIPSVLIEVVMAEVTLSDIENSGFDFLFKAALDRYGVTGGTRGKVGVKASGFSATFSRGDETRAMLGIFYEDSRVVIRSRPRVLVKSGQTATIEVGNEIPVISQVADSGTQTDGGATNFLQEVSYRKTGVQLEITPIVQASGRVDLEISQSLSEARPTAATSLAGNPTILNRHFSTSLTLQDGGALLMGGLISGSRSGGDTGVPGIAQVPVLGRLFRSDSYQEDRTELMVMVIPYVVADHQEGWELTQRMRDQLELHAEMMD